MNIKRYLKGLPVVAALLLTASCSNEENETVEAPQPEGRIIPFEATATSGSQTRAIVNGEEGSYEYRFEDGDKLYVWGTDIYGELSMVDGSNKGTSATFKGTLTYTGEGEPDNSLTLNAVIKGPNDQILGTLAEFKGRDYQPAYTTALATSTTCNAEAVQKFSYITATSNYQYKSFTFYQQSTFITFNITLEDGTPAGQELDVTFSSGSGDDIITRVGGPATVNVGGAIKAKFTAAFPGGTTLDKATIKLDSRDPISFGGTETLWSNIFYQVNKSYGNYKMTASATIPAFLATLLSIDGGEQSKTMNFKVFPYENTLQTLLSAMGYPASLGNLLDDCVYKEGDNNIEITELGGTPKDFKLEAKAKGKSTITATAKYGSFSYNIDVVIDVKNASE